MIPSESEQATTGNRYIAWMRAEGYRWRQICRVIGSVRLTA